MVSQISTQHDGEKIMNDWMLFFGISKNTHLSEKHNSIVEL